MKKQTHIVLFALALVAILLPATVSAATRPRVTPFEAVAYICTIDPAAREWYTDDGTVLHQRGLVFHSILMSDEPRMNGTVVDVGHQDLNLVTGDGRIWGRGTVETDVGTWREVWKGNYTGFVVSTRAIGHGHDGLEGQAWYWEGQPTDIGESDPCPDGALQALLVTGSILEH